MHTISKSGGLALLVAMLGCTAVPAPAEDTVSSMNLSKTTPSFVLLSPAACPAAPCPAYFAHDANRNNEGENIARLDFSKSTLGADDIAEILAAPMSEIVVKGTLGPKEGGLHTFLVTEAYRGVSGATFEDGMLFYQASNDDPPPSCPAAPCKQGSALKINALNAVDYDAIDVTAAARPGTSAEELKIDVGWFKAIAAGNVRKVAVGGARDANVLTASQVFVQLPRRGPSRPIVKEGETELLGPDHKPLLLRGWNWGHWGSVQPEDSAAHVTQGANIVRIPLRWWGNYEPNGTPDGKVPIDSRTEIAADGYIDPRNLAMLEAMIDDAGSKGLWIDMFFDSDCGQAKLEPDDGYCGKIGDERASFWNDPVTKEKFYEAWEFLVKRFRKKPFIAMWELLPEPQFTCGPNGGCKDWHAPVEFYEPLIARIRAIDPATPILVGPNSGYNVQRIDDVYMPNVKGLIYTGNFLDNGAGHLEWVDLLADFRLRRKVPVFVQQVASHRRPKDGEDDAYTHARADAILKKLNANRIGWTWWTYRETKSALGNFAPYWRDSEKHPWQSSIPWLNLIANRLH
ncbi:glycoside hydrolase family 5 protein [Pendulispora albinea]|uniref:Glycoside hydrolase family 5 protein n=1 Tax=Pendulispora albinea TaxID=2741071 RepID=A0ABZ2LPR4_9BACT